MNQQETPPAQGSLTIEQALAQAIEQHQAGQLQAAEQLYRAILQAQPAQTQANYYLGVLAVQLGRAEIGLPLLENAAAADGHPRHWLAYLDALLQTGQRSLAEQELTLARQHGLNGAQIESFDLYLRQGLAAVPADAQARTPSPAQSERMIALSNAGRYLEAAALAENFPLDGLSCKVLGAAQRQMGQRDSALATLQRAAALSPQDVEVHNNLGNALRAQGRQEDARACFIRAIRLRPDFAQAHNNLGNALQDLGRATEAEACYRKALQLKPELVEAHNNLGNTLRARGRLTEAQACFERALKLRPGFAEAHNNLGNTLRDLKHGEEACANFRQALAINPNLAQVHNNLGATLNELGRSQEALDSLRQALALQPNYAEAHFNLGIVLHALQQLEAACASFRQALLLRPQEVETHFNLGNALSELGRHAEAEACFRAALALRADYIQAHNNLAIALRNQGRIAESAACFQQALALEPDNAQTHNNLGIALWDLGRLPEAEACYRRAIALQPDYADAYSNLGSVLMDFGKRQEADQCLSQAIALAPGAAGPLSTALLLLPYRQDDPRFQSLEAIYAQRAALTSVECIKLNFAMGRAMESARDYERAFAAYEEGNRLHFQLYPVDEATEQMRIERTRRIYHADWLAQCEALTAAKPAPGDERIPVFIVGMPRSGTSLIEQILASHPALFGAGELPLLSTLAQKADRLLSHTDGTEALLANLRRLGNEYLDQVWQLAPRARFITDKMPENFYHLGLIRLMLPHAKIIHSLRDPLDTCFSCFSILFRQGHEYSYDLAALGKRYRGYEQLMRHWRQALPPATILDVRYENTVADLETEARRLLDYLGLPWDPACLRFHQTERTVNTASVAQVRQPIYTSSVARWKHFEQHLDLLKRSLQA